MSNKINEIYLDDIKYNIPSNYDDLENIKYNIPNNNDINTNKHSNYINNIHHNTTIQNSIDNSKNSSEKNLTYEEDDKTNNSVKIKYKYRRNSNFIPGNLSGNVNNLAKSSIENVKRSSRSNFENEKINIINTKDRKSVV